MSALVIRDKCGASVMALPSTAVSELDQERLKELASIARLISYARQSAQNLDADFPVRCLDMALAAILQEIYPAGAEQPHLADFDEDAGTLLHRH